MGATMMPIMTAALATLSDHNIARGSTFLNITQQVAASIGTALFSVLLTNGIKDSENLWLLGAVDALKDQPASSPPCSSKAGLDPHGPAAAAAGPGAGRHGRRVRLRVRRRHDPGRLLPDPGVLPAAAQDRRSRSTRRCWSATESPLPWFRQARRRGSSVVGSLRARRRSRALDRPQVSAPSVSGSTAPAPASRSARAARVRVQPVTTRSSTSRTGPPSRGSSSCRRSGG